MDEKIKEELARLTQTKDAVRLVSGDEKQIVINAPEFYKLDKTDFRVDYDDFSQYIYVKIKLKPDFG